MIKDEFSSLVNPETYFDSFNTVHTGISEESVADAPNFAELWQQIEPLMNRGILYSAVFIGAAVILYNNPKQTAISLAAALPFSFLLSPVWPFE